MSSVIFQPLLHDPLGWKSSKSTYTDHFKWKKYRSASKDKKLSSYGQGNRKQTEKQPEAVLHALPTVNHEQETIKPIVLANKNENSRGRTVTYRSASAKTSTEHPPVYIVEYKQRPVSGNEAVTSSSASADAVQRVATAVDDKPRTEKDKAPLDANNDNSRHWLTYPNPKTPQYIIDIKQRLGQVKGSSTLGRPASASNPSVSQPTDQNQASNRPTSASSQKASTDDQHQFLNFERRETPEDLRAARYRLDKHRYHASLDTYPPRPQTCPVRTQEQAKPVTPPDQDEGEMYYGTKTDAWVADDEERSVPLDQEPVPSIVVQLVDCDGLPPEYADALETANAAQEEYQRNLRMTTERRLDSPAYRLPSMFVDNQTDSVMAYHTHQQPVLMSNSTRPVSRSSPNNFGSWVRNATDRERASAMKILQDVLNQPVTSYESPTKQKAVFKQAPAPPPIRVSSATRKLGRTRTQHKFPCEVCEKLLIKRHVWDLGGSDTIGCAHNSQGMKSSVVQVRT